VKSLIAKIDKFVAPLAHNRS